jgi:hypothetical protein
MLSHPPAGTDAPWDLARGPAAASIPRTVRSELPPAFGFIDQEQRRSFARNEAAGSLQKHVEHLVEIECGGQRFGRIDEKGEVSNFFPKLASESADLSL